jgi:hypothetical protein
LGNIPFPNSSNIDINKLVRKRTQHNMMLLGGTVLLSKRLAMSSAAPIRIHTHTSRLLSSASIDSTRRPPGIRFVKPHDVHHRRPSTISSPPFVTTSSLQIRSNFSYAGPRKLQDILKTELIEGKTKSEIQDLWLTYHEGKEKIHGLSLDGAKAKTVLSRAAQCPFFIHPVFRDEGHFMIVSQFQAPNHFLLAFLEDYQMGTFVVVVLLIYL